jgi:hypothetical protein
VEGVWNFCAHVPISATIEVVAGLPCCERAAAASADVKGEFGCECDTLIVDAALVVVVAGLADVDVSLSHWHVPVVC